MLTRPAAAALLLDLCLGGSAAGAVTVPMGPRVGAPYEPGLTAALSRASCSSLHSSKTAADSKLVSGVCSWAYRLVCMQVTGAVCEVSSCCSRTVRLCKADNCGL
jgi:hypothetical protein